MIALVNPENPGFRYLSMSVAILTRLRTRFPSTLITLYIPIRLGAGIGTIHALQFGTSVHIAVAENCSYFEDENDKP